MSTCPSLGLGDPTMQAEPNDGISSNWTYSWTSNMGMVGLDSYTTQTVNLIDNVSRTYTVTLTNIFDPSITCTASIDANSASYSTPSIDVEPVVTTCRNVPVNIGDPASNSGLTYSWTNGSQLNNPNISYPVATVSTTTNFQITARDNSTGCAVAEDILVSVAESAKAGADLLVCDNGVVRIGANTDEDGYNYSWEPIGANWQNGSTANDMRPEVFITGSQQFILTTTDTAGVCTSTDTMNIVVEALPPSFALPNLSFCPSQAGDLVLGNSDGTTSGTNLVPNGYSYAWSPSNISDASIQNPIVTPLPTTATTYEIQVLAPNGCAQKVTQTITPIISAPIVANSQSICLAESIAIGSDDNPTSGITYSWSPTIGLDNPFSPNPIFTPSAGAVTTFTLSKTSGGCTTTAQVTITVEDFMAPILFPQNICIGSSTEIGVPSNSSYSYQWSPTTGLDNPYISNPTFSGTSSTNFTLTVANNIGCIAQTATSVTVNAASPVDITAPDISTCLYETPSVVLNSSISPAGNYSYNWSPSVHLSNANVLSPTFYIPSLGAFDFDFELEVVDQTNGCSYYETLNVEVYVACEEICDNGIDDDLDGLIDCEDDECIPAANPATLNTCDNSNMTGSGVFFLHDANPTVSTESGVVISYHPNLSDAQNGINNLISPHTSSDGTVYTRVERMSTGCYNTALITLNVGAKCVESCVNKVDDDGDGLIDCLDSDCPCCTVNAPTLDGNRKN